MTNLWREHLETSLKDQRVVSYMWDTATDYVSWAGDLYALLGLEGKDIPVDHAQFARLINPQDLPQRMDVFHSAEEVGDTLQASYRLRQASGGQVEITESATLHIDNETGEKVFCGTLMARNAATTGNTAPEEMPLHASAVVAHAGRRTLCNKIDNWTAQVESGDKALGYLLVVGMDRLALMNEAYGAIYVDELIERTGARMCELVGDAAFVSRINGDVFGIFFESGPHNEMASVAQYILNSFYKTPLETSHGHINIGVSIGGVALTPRDTRDVASVLTRGEMALQVAKDRGRGCFVSYSEASAQAMNSRVMLESGDAFLRALKNDRVRVAFQPVVGREGISTSFHECLIRMIGEDGKLHAAGEFMPAIEHLGMSRLVDGFAMSKAIHELSQFPNLSLSVNVSYMTLTSKEWLRGVVSVLRDRPRVARRLIIEITEGMVMKDVAMVVGIMKTLKDLGCRVALDDFGAGFTAFSQLKDMDFDIVKIDKSFIRNIKDRRNHLFIKTLQGLADGMEIETVGEGVETLEDARILVGEGINHIQGYAFGFPCVERVWLPKEHAFRHIDDPSGTEKTVADQDAAWEGKHLVGLH